MLDRFLVSKAEDLKNSNNKPTHTRSRALVPWPGRQR